MSMQLKITTVLGLVLLSITAIPAGAMVEAGGYHREIHNISLMDTNGDNQVSNDEFTRFYETTFDSLDINGDKVLDAKEWVAGNNGAYQVSLATGGYSRQITRVAGDRAVSRKEFLEYHRSFTEAINKKNRDGQFNPQSWLARLVGVQG